MNGAMKAAWVLTAFVIVAGLVLWIVTGKAVFAVFLVLGLLTGVGLDWGMPAALWLLAALSVVTVWQRVAFVFRQDRGNAGPGS